MATCPRDVSVRGPRSQSFRTGAGGVLDAPRDDLTFRRNLTVVALPRGVDACLRKVVHIGDDGVRSLAFKANQSKLEVFCFFIPLGHYQGLRFLVFEAAKA